MRPHYLILIVGIMLFKAPAVIAQQNAEANTYMKWCSFLETDSGAYVSFLYSGTCKENIVKTNFLPYPKIGFLNPVALSIHKEAKFLSIRGNVAYDYFFRSKIDTPISQENFQQHTERIYLDVLVKGKYPFRANIIARQSNSPYFKDFLDLNLQFDRYGYRRNLKEQFLNKLSALPAKPEIKSLEDALRDKIKKLSLTGNWLANKSNLQKLIDEKERRYNQQLQKRNNESLYKQLPLFNPDLYKGFHRKQNADDADANKIDAYTTYEFTRLYQNKKFEYDSLNKEVNLLQAMVDSFKNLATVDQLKIRQQISGAKNEKELFTIAEHYKLNSYPQNKSEKYLSSVKNLSIGRSLLNYTELTAQNITVTGINIEYNPSYYAAFAVGKIDYRFRDFVSKNKINTGQYIVLGRLGIGDIEKRALIFSVFKGKKSQADYAIPDSVNSNINLVGYSVEGIIRKNEFTSISAEVAKSTLPVTGSLHYTKAYNSLFKFSDKTNLGVNIKAGTIILETDTRISGFYRKTGENFQSFSLFSYNTDQTAWQARVDQSFLKRKISIIGMLRQNDFTNPFTDKTFKTSTTFKTIILTLRFPKYPSLSLGYYPGSQLYIINKEKIRENAYYILNGSLVYTYRYKDIGMNSSFVLNHYYNRATDSGFILYKGINYYGSHTVFLKNLQVQGGFAYTKQPDLHYYTLETSVDYFLKKLITAGVGSKFNHVEYGNSYWGSRVRLTADFKSVGSLQLEYEKSYLPTISQALYPIETGRLSWFKIF